MWTLEKFQKLSELVAALAVIATLAIVAYEVRQNTTAIRSAAAQAVNENFTDWYTAVQDHPELLALSMKGMKDYKGLEAVDKAQFIAVYMPNLLNSQNAFYHWRDGSLSPELWQGWEFIVTIFLTTPGGKEFWSERGYLFGSGFQKHVDEVLLTREPHPKAKPWGNPEIYE
jgi:hypothetical protein